MERRETPRPVEPVPAAAPVVTPPASAPTPAAVAAQRTSKAWVIGVPVAIVLLIGVIWALLAGMPFGGSRSQSDQIRPTAHPSVDTVAEGTSTAVTGSIGDVSGVQSEEPVPPPMAPPPMISNAPPVQTTTIAPPASPPLSATVPPAESAPQPSGEIVESQAKAVLARYLDARDPYHTPGNCLDVRGTGYSNRGYAFDVLDRCQSRRLGSWRVDAVTRELFEQKPDGRYLRP